MKTALKALAASAFALALAGPASAHVDVRIHAGPPAYYYPPVVVHPRYAPPPGYDVYGDPHWRTHDGAAWRHEQWLRQQEWRRQQWHREQWRHKHRHHYKHHHRHHHRHGWDGRY